MGDKTNIAWTNSSWNPIRGCSIVSEGCRNCYAMKMAARFTKRGQAYEGLAYRNESGAHWTGEVKLIEKHLEDPFKWKAPRKIFVNSMSDLFHESIPTEWIDRIFVIMALANRHTYQVLTKRPERMREYLSDPTKHERWNVLRKEFKTMPYVGGWTADYFPRHARHIWLGVSCEDQKTADARIPALLATPAAIRFVSYEPALAPASFMRGKRAGRNCPDWVIIGGESGSKRREMPLPCLAVVRDCVTAGVPVFVKQDSGPRPGLQGRIPNELWLKEFPK